MPKQVVHWGKHYKLVKQEPTENSFSKEPWYDEYQWDGSYQTDNEGNILPLPPGTEAARYPTVEVVWTRPEDGAHRAYDEDAEGHVQIGMMIDMVDMRHHFRYDKDGINDPDLKAKTFYTRGLTRTQINEFIKTLKRARDAAFGADQ